MPKLHELLAVEKTVTEAWDKLYKETMDKLGHSSDWFTGYSKSLSMIEDNPANRALEQQASEEKQVTTTVVDTLDYAFDIYCRAEDLQYQKNSTNRVATGDVMWNGQPLLVGLPVDELLGLESRLVKIRAMFEKMPTMAGSKKWVKVPEVGPNIWQAEHPEVNTKTEKIIVPVELSKATDKHPAQIQAVGKDVVVGSVTTIWRSGCATTNQKAAALKIIDDLLVEVKQARMRANQTTAEVGRIGGVLKNILMEAFTKD